MARIPPTKREDFQRNPQRPQFEQDSPDYAAGYLNDTPDKWLRGGGESAETKPFFDRSQAQRK
jgi:hypothetical protein